MFMARMAGRISPSKKFAADTVSTAVSNRLWRRMLGLGVLDASDLEKRLEIVKRVDALVRR